MKNLSTSYLFKPQEYLLELEDDRAASALTQGLYHQVEDWVALELTAEQMLQQEAMVVGNFVASDAKLFWRDLKGELMFWERAAGEFMLCAADPTQLEWQLGGWWEHQAAV
jgi:hypothetical protein